MAVAARPLRGRRSSVNDSTRPEHLFEGDADLEARQVRAETEVDAVAEGQMRVGVPAEDERVRLGEAAGVPVGRALPDDDLLARRGCVLAAELASTCRRPPLGG